MNIKSSTVEDILEDIGIVYLALAEQRIRLEGLIGRLTGLIESSDDEDEEPRPSRAHPDTYKAFRLRQDKERLKHFPDLSVRVGGQLRRSGYTRAEIEQMTDEDLSTLNNIGKKGQAEIRSVIPAPRSGA